MLGHAVDRAHDRLGCQILRSANRELCHGAGEQVSALAEAVQEALP